MMVQGSTARGRRHVGVRRRLQVLRRQQQLRGQQPRPTCATASRGARAGRCASRPAGALRRFDVAADIYRGQVGSDQRASSPKTTSSASKRSSRCREFLFQTEWARGKSLGQTRTGYYLQPAFAASTKTGSRSTGSSSSKARESVRAERRHWRA